jgi:protein SCO1/2
VNVVFVTVDPARDTHRAHEEPISAPSTPRIRGLTGTEEQVTPGDARLSRLWPQGAARGGGYTMDHTAFVYLMDKDGGFIGAFNIEQPPAQAAQEWLRHL